MNAIVDNQPVTWRPGFTVEVNALWYNALKYISQASTSGKIKDNTLTPFCFAGCQRE